MEVEQGPWGLGVTGDPPFTPRVDRSVPRTCQTDGWGFGHLLPAWLGEGDAGGLEGSGWLIMSCRDHSDHFQL